MHKVIAVVALLSVVALAAGPANAGIISGVVEAAPASIDLTQGGTASDWMFLSSDGSGNPYYTAPAMTTPVFTSTMLNVNAGGTGVWNGNWNAGIWQFYSGGSGGPAPAANNDTSSTWFHGLVAVNSNWSGMTIVAADPGAGNTGILTLILAPGIWNDVPNPTPLTADTYSTTITALSQVTLTYDSAALVINYGNGGSHWPKIGGASLVVQAEEPVVPEPATLLLVGTGAAGVFGYARRRLMK